MCWRVSREDAAVKLPVCVVSDQLRGSVSSLLQTVARDEDMSWARREQQALGRMPSRGGWRTELLWKLIVITTKVFCTFKHWCRVNLLVPAAPPAPSPLPSRSRSSSVGEYLGLGGGRAMRALVSHPSSSNPKLLPFNRGETVTVLVQEPRNGWLYGRTESSLRWVTQNRWFSGFINCFGIAIKLFETVYDF